MYHKYARYLTEVIVFKRPQPVFMVSNGKQCNRFNQTAINNKIHFMSKHTGAAGVGSAGVESADDAALAGAAAFLPALPEN
jgi:hypothetical protein